MQTLSTNNLAVTLLLKLNGTRCNMRCEYCYRHVSCRDKNDLTNISCSVDEAINYLAKYINYKHIFIVFHGGEPLLSSVEDIERILFYIKNAFKYRVSVQFQTNGILLTNEWIDLFAMFGETLSVSVSLDPLGIKDLRRCNVTNYRELVWKNIGKVSEKIPNVGIISVAHRYNVDSFIPFIEKLVSRGIKSLTINKYQSNSSWQNDPIYITESEYVAMQISIIKYWIASGTYKKLNIQPFNSLFSSNNKLCIYLPDKNKCSYFHTFYDSNHCCNMCDHIETGHKIDVPDECSKCSIYNKCGSGCLAEIKDSTFCNARKRLFDFIAEITK